MSKFFLKGPWWPVFGHCPIWFVNHNMFRNILNSCGVSDLVLIKVFSNTPIYFSGFEWRSFRVPCADQVFAQLCFLSKYSVRDCLGCCMASRRYNYFCLPFKATVGFPSFEKKHIVFFLFHSWKNRNGPILKDSCFSCKPP